MTTLLWTLIAAQIVMGGLDTIGHHEVTERLAWRRSQRHELRLHALRNLFYGGVLAGLATVQPGGWLALALIVVLVAEFLITLKDFAEEDATRKLPVTERLLHTVLTANYGAILVLLIPVLIGWSAEPAGLTPVWHGWWSLLCLAGAAATTVLALRDWLASDRFDRLVERGVSALLPRGTAPMTVLVTGGTGFIGQRLTPALQAAGHRVILLARQGNVRGLRPPFTVVESLEQIADDTAIDAVINLAGAPIMAGLWTDAAKARMLDSRVQTTAALGRLIDRLHTTPGVLVSGSAIGAYGVHPGAVDEDSWIEVDGSFSQQLCLLWEAEAKRIAARHPDLRTVLLRIGVVLGRDGGALGQQLVPTEYAGGTRLGSGAQRISWISRDDVVAQIVDALGRESLRGPVNAATGTVTQAEFARALARALHRPSLLFVPRAVIARLAMGREILLADQAVTRARPGPAPLDPDLDGFLARELGRRAQPVRDPAAEGLPA